MLKANYKVLMKDVRNQHLYYIEGEDGEYKSVTYYLNIISSGNALINWAKRQVADRAEQSLNKRLGKRVLISAPFIAEVMQEAIDEPQKQFEAAGDFGTRAHEVFDRIVKGDYIGGCDEDIKDCVKNFAEWYKHSGLRLIQPDTAVISKAHGYGGRFDALYKDRKGAVVLADNKTTKRLYPDKVTTQLAAYARATEETYGICPSRAIAIRIDKVKTPGPGFEVKEVKDLEASFKTFLHAKNLKDSLPFAKFNRGELAGVV